NRVCQTRPQHDECMLPFAFRCAGRPPHGVVKPPQRAARAGIEIAHPADHHVRLIVEVQAVVDQFVQIDLRRTLTPLAPIAARPPVAAAITTVAAPIARTSASVTTTTAPTAPLRTILAVPISLLFSHVCPSYHSALYCQVLPVLFLQQLNPAWQLE